MKKINIQDKYTTFLLWCSTFSIYINIIISLNLPCQIVFSTNPTSNYQLMCASSRSTMHISTSNDLLSWLLMSALEEAFLHSYCHLNLKQARKQCKKHGQIIFTATHNLHWTIVSTYEHQSMCLQEKFFYLNLVVEECQLVTVSSELLL